jgi:hypothetical protein
LVFNKERQLDRVLTSFFKEMKGGKGQGIWYYITFPFWWMGLVLPCISVVGIGNIRLPTKPYLGYW